MGDDYLPEKLRAQIRPMLADPDHHICFSTDTDEDVFSLLTQHNMAVMVREGRHRLDPGGTDGAHGTDAIDQELAFLAGCYHFVRLGRLPGEEGAWDRRAALGLFTLLHAVRPEAVPTPWRQAVRAPDPMALAGVLDAVGMSLSVTSSRAADAERSFTALSLLLCAREAVPPGVADPDILHHFGVTLFRLGELNDDPLYRKAAYGALGEAATAAGEGHPSRRAIVADLGRTRQAVQAYEVPDVYAAIRADPPPGAADGPENGGPDNAGPEGKGPFGGAAAANELRVRFEVQGDLDDLEQSIVLLREVIAATAPDDPTHRVANSALCLSLSDRYEVLGERADLEAAVAAARASLRGSDIRLAQHAQFLTNLAAVLTTRFRVTGDRAEIDEAVSSLEDAVALAPPSQSDHPVMRIKLGVALRSRGERGGGEGDVERAASVLGAVVRDPAVHEQHRHLASLELGYLMAQRWLSGGDPRHLAAAGGWFRATARAETEDMRTRLHAASLWGRQSTLAGQLAEAGEAYGLALGDLLPKLAGLSLGRRSQESRLRDLGGLAGSAAAVAVAAGRPQEAVVRLEQGRGLLLAQAMRLRDRLDALAAAEPSLAEEFERVRAELVTDAHLPPARRRSLLAEHDTLVERVRRVPGFDGFQVPLDWRQLGRAADQGPVAVVNVSPVGCHALLLRPGAQRRRWWGSRARPAPTVEALPLDRLDHDEVPGRAKEFLAAIDGLCDPAVPFGERLRHDATVTATLRWLWDTVTGPVLTALGLDGPAAEGGEWPRMWWCPTGALSLLPLHAALDPDGGCADDRVVASYSPTLAALLHARGLSVPSAPSLVTVGVPDPGAHGRAEGHVGAHGGAGSFARLTGVEEELEAVDVPGAPHTRLRGERAGASDVLAALRGHTHAHLACHGVHDPADPSGSRLLLHGGALSVREVSAQLMPDAELAYLSACHTAAPADDELVDEVISLASAFQLAGYRQVIGGLWPLDDRVAPVVAREVYRALGEGGPQRSAAYALHGAARALRTDPRWAAPLFWAPLVHIGP